MVVDCGGGTVDITVHELETDRGSLKELYKATGGPFGSTGTVDLAIVIPTMQPKRHLYLIDPNPSSDLH